MIRGRKKKTPPKPIDLLAGTTKNLSLSNVAVKGPNLISLQDTLPPLPAVPTMITPPRVSSPHDTTQIIMNGKSVYLNKDLDDRINGEERIRPITPPNNNIFENKPPEIIRRDLSPNIYTDSNVKIVDTPPDSPVSKNEEDYDEQNSSPIVEEFIEPIRSIPAIPPPPPSYMFKNSNLPSSQQIPVENVISKPFNRDRLESEDRVPPGPIALGPSIPEPPKLIALRQKDNYPFDKVKAKNMKSLLPVLKPKLAIEINSEEKKIEETTEKPQAFSPVNIPYPIFESSVRAISPIQTIGPKSPGVMTKPIFTEEGKSSTPKITTPTKPSSVKASTPPPLFRSPKKVYQEETQTPIHIPSNNIQKDNDISEEEFKSLYQQYKQYQGHSTPQAPEHSSYTQQPVYQGQSRISNRPNYSKVSREQEIYLRQEFKVKFGILRSTYPQWDVVIPDDSLSLEQIHDLYDHYLKQIMISRESGNYKTYMVIFLMVIEVIGVRFLKLNMSGYTLSQLKIMNRYDALFIELGEKYLISGGSDWPVEARIVMMMLFNAVIFLVVRYLCSWMGMEGIADTLQNMIDSMLNGPSMISQNSGPIGSSNPIPDPININTTQAQPKEGGNAIDQIADMFGSFMNKNGGGITEKIAEFGTMFTQKTQNSNKAQAQKAQEKQKVSGNTNGKRKINKKKLFDD
jgi:hypothetical protein